VKLSRIMAVSAICFSLICLIGLSAIAQQGNPSRPPIGPQAGGSANIALIDVNYIFKNHPRFKAMMEEMKADVDKATNAVNKEKETLQKLVAQLDTFRKGTADYNAMEKEIAQREADLTVKVNLQRKEFLTQEAKIYFTVYKEIEQEVEYYCATKGIDIVLRFNGDPADVEKPDSVLSFINKPVVYYDKGHDITKPILDTLVLRSSAPAGGNRVGRSGSPFQPNTK
jgi:Skp family chaperone for outer membrane proteins